MNKRQEKKTRPKLDCDICDEETFHYGFYKCSECDIDLILCNDCKKHCYCKQCKEEFRRTYFY